MVRAGRHEKMSMDRRHGLPRGRSDRIGHLNRPEYHYSMTCGLNNESRHLDGTSLEINYSMLIMYLKRMIELAKNSFTSMLKYIHMIAFL